MSTTRDSNAPELAWCAGGRRRMMQDLEPPPAPLRVVGIIVVPSGTVGALLATGSLTRKLAKEVRNPTWLGKGHMET